MATSGDFVTAVDNALGATERLVCLDLGCSYPVREVEVEEDLCGALTAERLDVGKQLLRSPVEGRPPGA
jgi:hypothetical protein